MFGSRKWGSGGGPSSSDNSKSSPSTLQRLGSLRAAARGEEALTELRNGITRIEELVEKGKSLYIAQQEAEAAAAAAAEDGSNRGRGLFRSGKRKPPAQPPRAGSRPGHFGSASVHGTGSSTRARKGAMTTPTKRVASASVHGTSPTRQATPPAGLRGRFKRGKPQTAPDNAPPSTPPRSPSAKKKKAKKSNAAKKRTSNSDQPPNTLFVPYDTADEAELVELLRRVAELVVRGERAAAAAATLGRLGSSSVGEETDEMDFEGSNAVFDHFCERNGLSLIVGIVTGSAYELPSPPSPEPQDGDSENDADHEAEAHDDGKPNEQQTDDEPKQTEEKEKETDEHSNDESSDPEKEDAAPDSTSGSGQLSAPAKADNDATDGAASLATDEESTATDTDATTTTAGDVTTTTAGEEDEEEEAEDDNEQNHSQKIVLLPPFVVVTQGVQSVSILVQNVVLPTSLYFLLSNNRINDLIGLPLELYSIAEQNYRAMLEAMEKDEAESKRNRRRNKKPPMRPLSPQPARRDQQSAEMSELSTHFVTFLKSLALRMNAETLQFFLTYAKEGKLPPPSPKRSLSHVDDAGGNMRENLLTMKTSSERLLAEGSEGHSSSPAKENTKEGAGKGTWGQDSVEALLRRGINFPLYDRALQFCSKDQENFVRVTAMNICLNTLRLAAVVVNDDAEEGDDQQKENDAQSGAETPDDSEEDDDDPQTSSSEIPLPFRERLAIAQHVCATPRVEKLVSPIFINLAQMCGTLEETIRGLDEIAIRRERRRKEQLETKQKEGRGSESGRDSSVDTRAIAAGVDARSAEDAKLRDEEQRRLRLFDAFQDVTGDLEEELILLEDVLKVGLTALNEQTIEMMLATFIYPFLLQPLSIHFHRRAERASSLSAVSGERALNGESQGNGKAESDACPGEVLNEEVAVGGERSERKLASEPASPPLDPTPAKMALVGITYLFHCISHRPLLNLLFTALWNPLGPHSTSHFTITCNPQIIDTPSRGRVVLRLDGIEAPSGGRGDDEDELVGPETYKFGQEASGQGHSKTKSESDLNDIASAVFGEGVSERDDNAFVFVLSPPLAEILNDSLNPTKSGSSLFLKRPNPYRRVLLDFLGSSDGMSGLQALTVYSVDAALSKLKGVTRNVIMYGGIRDEGDADGKESSSGTSTSKQHKRASFNTPNHMVEIISSLCVSVLGASADQDAQMLRYNDVAAHALCMASNGASFAEATAARLIEHRRKQASSLLCALPSRLAGKKYSPETVKSNQISAAEVNVIMDRIFYDPSAFEGRNVVENLGVERQPDASPSHEGPRAKSFVPVVLKGSPRTLVNYFRDESSRDEPDGSIDDAMARAAMSAWSYLQLDSLAEFLGNQKSGNDFMSSYNVVHPNSPFGTSFAPLSSRLSNVLYHDEFPPNDDENTPLAKNSVLPRPGAVVSLIGRPAFPCVCEVADTAAPLFTDEGTCVVSEGIKWQSLYLVLFPTHMLLAEPEKGGSGGNGVVVSSCKLSALGVKMGPAPPGTSPARRLLFVHESRDGSAVPVLFNVEDKDGENKRTGSGKGGYMSSSSSHHSKQGDDIVKSRLDLWFQDERSARRSLMALRNTVEKARSRRGQRLRDLFEQQSLQPSRRSAQPPLVESKDYF